MKNKQTNVTKKNESDIVPDGCIYKISALINIQLPLQTTFSSGDGKQRREPLRSTDPFLRPDYFPQ